MLTIAGSTASGLTAAALLCLVVFPGAGEPIITGSALLGFGVGWTLLAALSRRTDHPQPWAWLPASLMLMSGTLLVVIAPGATALSALGWVWPPVMAGLAAYCLVRMRRNLAVSGRWMLYPVLVGMVVASAGGAYVKLADIGDTLPPPGELYAVDGRTLHLDCRGTGHPTVVVQAGLAGSSASWARVMPAVASSTRVCAFDRSGQGWSEESPEVKDGIHAARDLHAVLAAAGEKGPYVMVGHSTGGTYALTYAAQHPDDIAGMVLLDSSSPDQFALIPSMRTEFEITRRLLALLPTFSRLGLGELVPASLISGLPAPAAEQVRSIYTSPKGLRNQRDEQAAIPALFRQAQTLESLGDRPLAVLTATVGAADGWAAAQEQLAGLSTNSSHRYAHVRHGGILDDAKGAAASVAAIEHVVAVVRERSRSVDDPDRRQRY